MQRCSAPSSCPASPPSTFSATSSSHCKGRARAKDGRPVTAFPQGVNIVPFFAFTQLIMAPTYREQLQAGAPPDVAARRAYDTGLAAAAVFALLELIGVPFVDTL